MQSPNQGNKGWRLRARLEATSAGLQELAILRKTQEAMIAHAKSGVRNGSKKYSHTTEKDNVQVGTVFLPPLIKDIVFLFYLQALITMQLKFYCLEIVKVHIN